jgi:hypothetical protein
MFAAASFVALALTSSVLAMPSPLTPSTTNAGQPCVISWGPDTTGDWTKTNIELMSGDNQNMVHITTIATVDTTDAAATSYTWTCPEVTPNSNIYFYQFSTAGSPTDLTWTTRFTIAGTDGATEEAENATQPDGSAVPWGVGNLVDTSKATPAPAYITGQTSANGASGSASVTGTGTASVAASTSSMGSMSMASSSSKMVSIVATSTAAAATRSASASASASTAAASSGAQRTGVAFALGAVALAGFAVLA